MRLLSQKKKSPQEHVYLLLERNWNANLYNPMVKGSYTLFIDAIEQLLKLLNQNQFDSSVIQPLQTLATLFKAIGNPIEFGLKFAANKIHADHFQQALIKSGHNGLINDEAFSASLTQLVTLLADTVKAITTLKESDENIRMPARELLVFGLCIATRLYETTETAVAQSASDRIFEIYAEQFTRLDLAKIIYHFCLTGLKSLGIDIFQLSEKSGKAQDRLHALDRLVFHSPALQTYSTPFLGSDYDIQASCKQYTQADNFSSNSPHRGKVSSVNTRENLVIDLQAKPDIQTQHDELTTSPDSKHTNPRASVSDNEERADTTAEIAPTTLDDLAEFEIVTIHTGNPSSAAFLALQQQINELNNQAADLNPTGFGPMLFNLTHFNLGELARLKDEMIKLCKTIHEHTTLTDPEKSQLLQTALENKLLFAHRHELHFEKTRTSSYDQIEEWMQQHSPQEEPGIRPNTGS